MGGAAEGGSRWLAWGVRAAMICLALAALGWAVFVAPLLWNRTAMVAMARKVIAGEHFAPGVLADFVRATERDLRDDVCQPVARRTIAIVGLRLAEEALATGDRGRIQQSQAALRSALTSSLNCAPTDPFLWLGLFWLETNVGGLQRENFTALRMSYRFGPNEGWLALKRNRYAIAIYPLLPDDLKQKAMAEFVQLVNSDFITDAADIVAGPGKSMSDTLLAHLEGIDQAKLRFLVRLLDGKGIEARVPGVKVSAYGRFD